MAQAPVSEFVGKNGNNLLGLALLNQSVIDDDMLLPGQSKEIGVAMRAALAAVDDVQLMQREVQLLGETLDISLKLAFLQGRQLVEQGQNSNGIDGNHEDLESSAEHPEIVKELAASLLDDGQETGQDGRGEDKGNQIGLDHIGDEELRCLLVEPKLLLKNEGMVDASWERQGLVEEQESEDKND